MELDTCFGIVFSWGFFVGLNLLKLAKRELKWVDSLVVILTWLSTRGLRE